MSSVAIFADVVIAGGGPAGATAAYHLAAAGHDVVVLEKTSYPRDKVCGDGLTPQAVRELDLMGVDRPESEGWKKIQGLRLVAGNRSAEIPWPETQEWPNYSLVKSRSSFDHALAEHARAAGADIRERHSVTEVLRNDSGTVIGVRAEKLTDRGRKSGEFIEAYAPVVIAADGNSTRSAISAGLHRRDDAPMAVAVRAYYTSPRHDDDWLESWLRLPDAEGNPLPGYGWLFPLGDGTVNVGLGVLDTTSQFRGLNYRNILKQWSAALGDDWDISEEVRVSKMASAALPMAFNRTPQYVPGMLLVGDSAGMVSPFNGEGISFAMEAARIAADTVNTALASTTVAGREAQLSRYRKITEDLWGRHFGLGKLFAQMIGHPKVLSAALATGFSAPALLRTVVYIMSNTVDRPAVSLTDRIVQILESITPTAPTDNRLNSLEKLRGFTLGSRAQKANGIG